MISRRQSLAGLLVLVLAISIAPSNRSAVGQASSSAPPSAPLAGLDEGYIGNPTAEFRSDADHDGLFDSLVVRVPFIVNVSGRFSLSAFLLANNTQAGNSTERNLAPGTYVVDMALPGWRIRLSRSDGPYNVSLGMYDPETSFSAGRSYRTAVYTWTTFEFLAELQGGLSETAIDANGDGLYNYLAIGGLLNVTQPGNYTLSATLSERGSSFIVGYAFNQSHWAAGVWQFLLRFSGDSIRTYGADGPYTIEIQLAHEYSDVWQRETFDTAAYRSSQFYHKPILLDGNLTDHGVDFDGNGLFEVLRIEIPVVVTVAGLYDIYGRLSDPYCIGCDITASRRVVLSPADHNTTLDFDGFLLLNSQRGQNTILDLDIAEDVTVYYIHASGATRSYTSSEFDNPYADWVNGLRLTTPDHNGDGLFDELRIEGTVLVKRAATLYVHVYASLGYCGYVCYLEDQISIAAAPGPISVEVSFPGWRIRAAGSNGTYVLSAALYTGPYFLQSSSVNTTFTYDQFSPALELRGPVIYRTVDNDGDGLANQVAATVPLRIFQPGPYTFSAAMYNATSYGAVYSTRLRYFEVGDVDVDFLFSGVLVRQLGANATLYLSTSLSWGFSTFEVLTFRQRLALDPSIFQTVPMKNITFSTNLPLTDVYYGSLRLVNYSNALVLDLRLDSRGQVTAAIPDLSYVGVAELVAPSDYYSWLGRLPAPLPANELLNVARARFYTADFLEVDLVNWSFGHAWLNRTLVGDPFSRLNADLTYDPDGILTPDEIQNSFKFASPGVVLGVNLRVDNSTVRTRRAGSDEGVGGGPVETGDPIALAVPWSLAFLGGTRSSHSIVVNLTGGTPYYTPLARIRVPIGWNVTDVAAPNGLVVTGVGTREVRIVVTENRTVPSDTVLTVEPVCATGPGRGRISGRVLGDDGAPLAGAHVAAILDGVEVVSMTTGPDGAFTCSGLPEGAYDIRISAEGYVTRSLTISLAKAEALDVGDIPLSALSKGAGIISGRIRDASMAPIPEASVSLLSGGTAIAQAQSMGDGSFRFDAVAPGTYTVRSVAPGFATRDVPAQVMAGATLDLGDVVLQRSSNEGTTGLGSWVIRTVAGFAVAAAAGVVWAWRRRRGSKSR